MAVLGQEITAATPSLYNSGNHFVGKIDEFRIWNTVKTQSEIDALRFNRVGGTTAGLRTYYTFDAPNITAGVTTGSAFSIAGSLQLANLGDVTGSGANDTRPAPQIISDGPSISTASFITTSITDNRLTINPRKGSPDLSKCSSMLGMPMAELMNVSSKNCRSADFNQARLWQPV